MGGQVDRRHIHNPCKWINYGLLQEEDESEVGESLISADEIKRFESQLGGKVEEKRAKLREDLKMKFARLCNVSHWSTKGTLHNSCFQFLFSWFLFTF